MDVKTFRDLHHDRAPGDPLILPGPWDAASARAFAGAGFPALATPSAGIAESLGYEDGATPADEMFAAVARIVRAVTDYGIPVSADLESGYGLPPRELVDRALAAGVVGLNIEDSDPTAPSGLADPHKHADRLAEIRTAAGDALFVNARVDTYVRGVPDLDETVRRARLYVEAGSDSAYPILAPADALPTLCATIPAPVNALALPDGPSPRELGRLGASRVTFGPGLLRRVMGVAGEIAKELR
ncbi:isocitrate lyase/phosphoenolpyruvate mutase family protein [Streptomyces sp. LHD-70]|uniref:isocitrate lyase/PEP mutase family protein n=1 Tax=Streptomyces sp. LHD-70 TaxID=3072140 RepID=UPI00280F0853|nr:isocitrate lyase/phosphoenolpyruvate mutase family protein [Streptomyces sp. LHD-70]MDQ8704237.1 isocitrate lyase/phosphoenolpyruvate mutase family protein [Streptomyces sp. LHD-70]